MSLKQLLSFKTCNWRFYKPFQAPLLKRHQTSDATKTASTVPDPDQSPSTFPAIGVKAPLKIATPTTAEDPALKINVDKVLVADMVKPSAIDEITRSVSFDDIPGPIALKYLSRIWNILPVIGTQVTGSAIQYFMGMGSILSWNDSQTIFKRMITEYGPVTRLRGPFGGDVVIISYPEHVASIFKNEGAYPVRASLDCVEKYRLQHRRSKNTGMLLMSGPEWEKFRKSVEVPLQSIVAQQFDKIDAVGDRFIARILNIRNRQQEVPGTFLKEIQKWSMESLFLITLDKKLGFLDVCGISSTSDPGILFDGFLGATDAIKRCERGIHLWKFMNTPSFSSLITNCERLESVLNKYIQRSQMMLAAKKDEQNQSKNLSLVESLLLKSGIMSEDALTILLDMTLIGVNATSHTVAFLLYHLAKNPKCQVKLYDEIARQPVTISKESLATMSYLQACIKETLRLTPPIPIIGRVLNNDTTVYSYHIPKGTYVLMATSLAGLREEYFEDAHKFQPERWTNPVEGTPNFAYIPFGYGARACLAKELAEVQVGTVLTKVLRKFRVEYLYGEIHSNNRLLAAPNKKLRFRFIDR